MRGKVRIPATPVVEGVSIRTLYDIDHVIPLGKGSFSEVVAARHLPTGTMRALKILRQDELTGSKAGIVTHEREILRRTRHPNIITLYETIRTSDKIYFVFDRMDEDLFEFIVRNNRINEALTRKIVFSILSAVRYLHSQSIVHRDIKPENILINVRYNPSPLSSESDKEAGGEAETIDIKKVGINNINPDHLDLDVKLTDFGFAKLVLEWDVRNTPCGTSFYIAPEIIRGIEDQGSEPLCTTQTLVKSVDVWSVGVVMYVLLAGTPPFYGQVKTSEERRALLKKINHGVLFSSKNGWDKVSNEAKNLILRLLELDSGARISAEEALRHPFFANLNAKATEAHRASAPLESVAPDFCSYGVGHVKLRFPRPVEALDKAGDADSSNQSIFSKKNKKYESNGTSPLEQESAPCMTQKEQERLHGEIAALQEEELLANDKEGDVSAYKRGPLIWSQKPARVAVMNQKLKLGPSALKN